MQRVGATLEVSRYNLQAEGYHKEKILLLILCILTIDYSLIYLQD